jgi:hypothetical protein
LSEHRTRLEVSESVEAQVDVVRLTAKFLREKLEKDKTIFDPAKRTFLATIAKKVDYRPDEPDSAERISAFLGEQNWSRRKVSDLSKKFAADRNRTSLSRTDASQISIARDSREKTKPCEGRESEMLLDEFQSRPHEQTG